MKDIKNIILPHDHGSASKSLFHYFPEYEAFEKAAIFFSVLGDPTRLKIFWLLAHCEECVVNIASITDMSSPAVSHHLRLLKNMNLIKSRKSGKEVYYTIANNIDSTKLHKLIDMYFEE